MHPDASPHAYAVTAANFVDQVIHASRQRPVLVDFWAPWCGPCRALGPLLEKLANDYGGRFALAKVNSDEEQALAAQFGIRSIPTVKVVVDGQIVDEFTGALPEAALRQIIDRHLVSPAEPLRQAALDLLADDQPEAALRKLAEASQLDPGNDAIRLDAAEVLLELGHLDQADALLGRDYPAPVDAERLARLRQRRALMAEAGSAAPVDELRATLAADPDDHASRLTLAKTLAAHGDIEGALEAALEVVRRDRSFGDDAGRKTLLQLFELFASRPDADPIVRRYRRALSAALN